MKHYLSIVFILLLLVACDPAAEFGRPFHEGQEVVLTAAIGEQRPQMMPQHPNPQRISGKDSDTTINLLWDEGDEIRVCVEGASSVFRLIDGAGTANASFIGTMPANGSSFEVSYPVNYSDTILQLQAYVPNGIAKGLMKMSTPSHGTIDDGFTLKAEHAVLGLQLTGSSEIGKLVLTKNGTDGKAATPSYTLNCTSIVHGKLSNSKSPGVTLTDSPTLFYIVLPTGTWEHGFTVTVYAADNTTIIDSLVTTKTFTFESTNATMMAAKEVLDIPDPCMVVRINDTLSINLMCVEGGTFRMGALENDTLAKGNEKPAHEVTLTYDYLIMQTEVTRGLWEAIMDEDIYDLIAKSPTPTAKPKSGKSNIPVGYVQLSQCLEFIDRLNALTGLHFRMPTEAEWEYAARGGNKSKGYLYAGSNTLTQVAQTSLGTVANLQPNELGIYDMSGNIAEMTLDYLPNHDIGYPSANAQVNPRQISPTGNRAIRGLRWGSEKTNCRISHRNAYTPTYCGNGIGFRLVLSEEQDFRTIQINGSYFDMSFVKGGTFIMGSDAPDAETDEKPLHKVTLSDYYIGQTEVTQHLWKTVMGSSNNPSVTKGDTLPVTNISWDDCQTFVSRLSEMTGLQFRLPTEAEWEYAARGGQRSHGYVYAGSNDLDSVAWHPSNCTQPQAVGKKKPNELGIYDMSGNVYEFCHDWYGPYPSEPQTDPLGPTTSSTGYRIARGGCWQAQYNGDDASYCRIANRGYAKFASQHLGLRIVLEIEK